MLSAVPERLLPGRYRSLFAEPILRRLMPVFAFSDLGDGMTVVAIPWLALALAPRGGGGALVGIAVAAYTLPGALGPLFLDRWMRRLRAQQLLVVDSGLRAGLLGAIPIGHAVGALTPGVYVALLGASSLLHAWGKAGKYALFAPVLGDEERLTANSLLTTSLWSATIAGPALAGLLAGFVSPAWIIGLNAATFAALALQAGRTELPALAPAFPAARDTRHTLSVLRRYPDLLALLAVTWLFNLAFGPVEVALPLFVTGPLHAGAGLLGQYWAAFGVGAVVGALALGVARRLPLWPAMLAIVAGHGVGMLPFAITHTAVPSMVGFAVAGLVYGPYPALSFTVFQDRAPTGALTGILAVRSAVLLTGSPLGAAAGGLLVDRAGAPAVLTGSGALMIVIALASAVVRKLGARPRR